MVAKKKTHTQGQGEETRLKAKLKLNHGGVWRANTNRPAVLNCDQDDLGRGDHYFMIIVIASRLRTSGCT